MDSEVATDGGNPRPDWVAPAVRCGLEVTLVVLITAYLWVNVRSNLTSGILAVVGIVGAVGVLFYYVNQQALAWVRYASSQSRRKKRRRQQQRRQQRRSQQQGGDSE